VLRAKPNLVVVVSDTLRARNLGCYGGTTRTPHIDAFAAQAAVFEEAYPESLPTIPVRRALHTGRRAFPFRDYTPVPWDIVYLPGWQPMDRTEDTLAEHLVANGYHTGFATDTLPYFAPGMTFTRGFLQWEFIRGQQQDRWRSPHTVSDDALRRYGDPAELRRNEALLYHIANTAEGRSEEDTSTARTFQWAMRFLEDNRKHGPLYLLVDAFAPHEPWDPPRRYLEIYADPDSGPIVPFLPYARAKGGLDPERVARAVAGYQGLVTLVDAWFGRFMETLQRLGMLDDTIVALISDHGTNFGENPDDVVGKPSFALFPDVMRIPLIVRMPSGRSARVRDLVYNHDLPATLYDYAGTRSDQGIHGRSLRPLLENASGWQRRDYLTSRYADDLWYRDRCWWLIYAAEGTLQYAFDLAVDPECTTNRAAECPQEARALGWRRLLDDAGGEIPCDDWRAKATDAIGRPVSEWLAAKRKK